MFYAWDIEIPPGTTELKPITKVLKLTTAVITYLGIKFPNGCHGLVKARLLRFGMPFFPLSRGEWVTGDGEVVPSDMYYPIRVYPWELGFEGCSPKTKYSHKITVRITMLPEEIATPWLALQDLSDIIKQLIGL